MIRTLKKIIYIGLVMAVPALFSCGDDTHSEDILKWSYESFCEYDEYESDGGSSECSADRDTLPPVPTLIFNTNTYKANEWTYLNFGESYDPDCKDTNSSGIDHCSLTLLTMDGKELDLVSRITVRVSLNENCGNDKGVIAFKTNQTGTLEFLVECYSVDGGSSHMKFHVYNE